MQPLRFNPFNQIHKGLRALLYDTAVLIQHTDFTKEAEIKKVKERVHHVIDFFAAHADVEDHQVFPMITAFAPDVVDDFESQHKIDHELSEGLEKCLTLFTETNSMEQNLWFGNELLQAFNSFLAFNVEHMKKEETIINNVLWQHYSDAQLLQKVQQITASIPPEQTMLHSTWMLKGLSLPEIVSWYKAMQQTVPPPVFENFCRLAEQTLSQAKWSELKRALLQSAVLR